MSFLQGRAGTEGTVSPWIMLFIHSFVFTIFFLLLLVSFPLEYAGKDKFYRNAVIVLPLLFNLYFSIRGGVWKSMASSSRLTTCSYIIKRLFFMSNGSCMYNILASQITRYIVINIVKQRAALFEV